MQTLKSSTEYFCTFSRFLKRNEKTGDSVFTVKINNEINNVIKLKGIVYPYVKHTPLKIVCSKMHDEEYIYELLDIEPFGFSFETTCEYLYKNHTNVGMMNAKKIVNITGVDIFSYIKDENTPKDKISNAVIASINNMVVFHDLFSYIKSIGGNYYNADILFEKYGANTLKNILDNPYLLLYAGIKIEVCDKVAYDKNIEMSDKKRIAALTQYAVDSIRSNGHTLANFKSICKRVYNNEADSPYNTHPLFIAEELMSDKYIANNIDGDVYFSLRRDYEEEQKIIQNIIRLLATSVDLKNKTPISDIEKEINITYTEGQKKAFDLLNTSGVKIITGGPGTGKTTLLNGLLTKYIKDNPNKSFILCAPTGCAARRLHESTGHPVSTIHKMLDIRPFEQFSIQENKKLQADLIIVDESSMIDTYIMAILLSSIKNGALVIFIGDKDQLPPIGTGDVFRDMIDCEKIPTSTLDVVMRQSNGNAIIDNAHKIKNGYKNLKCNDNFLIKRFPNDSSLTFFVKDYMKNHKNDTKLYTPVKKRKFSYGTIELNKALCNNADSESSLEYGEYVFSIGDKVLFNDNNYDKGFFNGQEGIITNITKCPGHSVINIQTDDGLISLDNREIDYIDLGYALTAHKSQGNECKNSLIIIPQKPAGMLKRRLLYVEVTRAKENVMIVSEGDALEKCISCYGEYRRETNLLRMLKEEFYGTT